MIERDLTIHIKDHYDLVVKIQCGHWTYITRSNYESVVRPMQFTVVLAYNNVTFLNIL